MPRESKNWLFSLASGFHLTVRMWSDRCLCLAAGARKTWRTQNRAKTKSEENTRNEKANFDEMAIYVVGGLPTMTAVRQIYRWSASEQEKCHFAQLTRLESLLFCFCNISQIQSIKLRFRCFRFFFFFSKTALPRDFVDVISANTLFKLGNRDRKHGNYHAHVHSHGSAD